MSKNLYKKPNLLVYSIGKLITKFLAKFIYNIKLEKDELGKRKGPFVVIANHEASIDFIGLLANVKTRTHFVLSHAYYNTLPIRGLLNACSVIPKQQFQTTTADMKKMKRVIENNMPLMFFPAGLMTANGISTPIPEATAKVLKWLGADVYAAVTKGSYLTKPKWSKIKRKGKITIEITKLFDANDLENLNDEEIKEKIENTLVYDSYKNQIKNPTIHKNGNNIEGLENVLYYCPKCHKEFTLKTENDHLYCTNCGNTAIANKYGLLEKNNNDDVIYETPSEWSAITKDILAKSNIDSLESKCLIKMLNYKKRKFEFVGDGTVKLEKQGFTLNAIINNETVCKKISIRLVPTLPFIPGKQFDLQDGKDIYRIVLENPIETIKWVYLVELFNQK